MNSEELIILFINVLKKLLYTTFLYINYGNEECFKYILQCGAPISLYESFPSVLKKYPFIVNYINLRMKFEEFIEITIKGKKIKIDKYAFNILFRDSKLLKITPTNGHQELEENENLDNDIGNFKVGNVPLKNLFPLAIEKFTEYNLTILNAFYQGNRFLIGEINENLDKFETIIEYLGLESFKKTGNAYELLSSKPLYKLDLDVLKYY